MSNIPHDIIVNILVHLPVKSLCRFRCVSKTWLNLTYSPSFVATHLSLHQKHNIIFNADNSLFYLDHEEASPHDELLPLKIDVPPINDDVDNKYWLKLLGSCNGLVCVTPRPNIFIVFNPSTRETMKIPDCPFGELLRAAGSTGKGEPHDEKTVMLTSSPVMLVHGFGYAPSLNDYKFVSVLEGGSVLMFSLKNMSWKNVDKVPYRIMLAKPGINLNGALHWFCRGKDDVFAIAALDLATEKLSSGFSPPESVKSITQSYMLGVLKGRLCLLEMDGFMLSKKCVFWTMEEYGVKESWTSIKIAMPFYTLRPLIYSKCEKLLMAEKSSEMAKLNLCKGKAKNLLANGMAIPFFVDLYVESLVSPNIAHD